MCAMVELLCEGWRILPLASIDRCRSSLSVTAVADRSSVASARLAARSEGWRTIRSGRDLLDLCPVCARSVSTVRGWAA